MLGVILGLSAVVAGIDQLIKYFIVEYLKPVKSASVIDGLLSLIYVENRGVAFGMFQDHVIVFAIITALLISVFIYLIVKKKFTGPLFAASAVLMIGGGIGNLIDRIFRQYVVDYLSVSFFPPVCNFADYCITIGAVLFVIVLFMQTKDNTSDKTEPSAASENGEEITDNETDSAEEQSEEISDGEHDAK